MNPWEDIGRIDAPDDSSAAVNAPPDSAIVPPPGTSTTSWDTIGAASAQISAGQPVTALPRQAPTFAQGQAWQERMDKFDQQARAAAMAGQQAAQDAQMFDQMSRVARSTKDIEIARRSIDVMGLQRDIQNGVPIHEAVARHPIALGSGFGGAFKATAPAPVVPAPSVLNLPGMPPAVRSGLHGEHVQFPPASTAETALDTKGAVLNDPETGKRLGMVVRTGPHTQHIVLDKVPLGTDPRTANAIYGSQERGLLKQLEDLEMRAALLNPKNPKHQEAVDLQDQLKTVRQNRAALIQAPAAAAPVAPVAPAAKPVRRFKRNEAGEIVPMP